MELTDIIHFYLGCDMITDQGRGKLVSVQTDDIDCPFQIMLDSGDMPEELTGCKLILNSLKDITRADAIRTADFIHPHNIGKHPLDDDFQANAFNGLMVNGKFFFVKTGIPLMKYLLSHHYDLFGAIEAGIAVDAKDRVKVDISYPIDPEV